MGIEVVHYKDNLFCIRVHGINEVFYFFRPVNSRPVFPDADMMLSCKWFYKSKDTACICGYIQNLLSGHHRDALRAAPSSLPEVGMVFHPYRQQGAWGYMEAHRCRGYLPYML